VLTVGKAGEVFPSKLAEASKEKRLGYGMTSGVDIGPVITGESKERINKLIEKAVGEGAKLLLDGRNINVPGGENGFFVGPTILENVDVKSEIYNTEIFGPV